MNMDEPTACSLVLCFLFCLERGKRNSDPATSKKILKLENTVKELKEQVKELTTLCEKDLAKKIHDTQKTTKREITDLQNSMRKCCGNKYKPNVRGLAITADDEVKLYLDGEEIILQNGKQWDIPDIALLSKATSVIAVNGINLYADTGIIASTDDGFVLTNSSWKCTNKKEKGWEGIDFDDSAWPPASEFKSYADKPIEGIRNDAQWIWTDQPSFKTGDKVVYCRFTLPKSKKSG